MSQIVINSANIATFGFKVTLDIAGRGAIFNIAELTEFVGAGGASILGINFSLNDNSNNPLIPGNSGAGTWDWDAPNIVIPSTDENPDYAGESTFEVDLAALFGNNYAALFQSYKIQAAIKDEDGTVYETTAFVQSVKMPEGLTDYGYVAGAMTLKADCPNGYLTVKETTNFAYCGKLPTTTASEGSLYYPRGTIDPISYEFTDNAVAFTNNVVYTGNYKIINTTIGYYENDNGFITQIEFYTETEDLNIACEKKMLSVMCCLTDFQLQMKQKCSGAQYENMRDRWQEAGTWLAYGLIKENSGRDASAEAEKIRKTLNCECTDSSIRRISADPVNPMVYSISVTGTNGTTVTPSVVGNTRIFNVDSKVYRVTKKVPADLALVIETDTSVPGIVNYKSPLITKNWHRIFLPISILPSLQWA